MTKTSSAASVLARIQNEAKALGVSHELLMRRYVFERFLFRLSQSAQRDTLVLKGAMALAAVTRTFGRATRDLDMLGLETLSASQALDQIRTIAETSPSDPDPVVFDVAGFSVEAINVRAEEPGHQVSGQARIGNARIPLKIEIAHGHVVSPAPMRMRYPTVLDGTEAPEILCYTPETMLAEKFEAIVSLGVHTSRFKDFYDVRELSRKIPFDGAAAAAAFRATFERRGTSLPTEVPASFLPAFADIGAAGWRHFLKKLAASDPQSFVDLIAEIEPFVMRIAAMARSDGAEADWVPQSGWTSTMPAP
jgi:predicted nucleotidyltransferase component of viral defense system